MDDLIENVPELILLGFDEIYSAKPLGLHKHRGYEFVLIERGKASWELDGELYETHAGDAFHTVPGEIHRGGFNAIEPSRFWWLIVTPPVEEQWLCLPPNEIQPIRGKLQALHE